MCTFANADFKRIRRSLHAYLQRLQAACFRLTSLIFRTCLCCVYSLSFPGHFGNSNLSLSLIMRTTHSASGLGLPECLICCAFYCSHIVGAVNACVAVYCLLLQRKNTVFSPVAGSVNTRSHRIPWKPFNKLLLFAGFSLESLGHF